MLSIHNLIKIYAGPVNALQGVTLNIGEGLFGLLGPNGAGKSTLMNTVAGLLEPTSGSITLDGADIVKDPRIVRRQLGYLPQDFGFFPDLTGLRMLELMLKLKGVDGPGGRRKIAQALLERVNLSHAAKRKVSGYSGGMRQRLGLAQAIAGNPRLVIVDEPTAGLDPEERHRFYRLLAELAKNRIILLSTHIVEDVATLCPRMAVIQGGRVVADTTPRAARAAIDGHMFEGFIPDDQLDEFSKHHSVTSAILSEGSTNRVRVHSADANAAPTGFSPSLATLEDAYLVAILTSRSAELAAINSTGAAA
ncbi:MAG: ABC transporter ATP-binding protein [Planctomycetes bacterium]|nr:ABC transporter ATP-binding protein [Planctomycetota bacterium]